MDPRGRQRRSWCKHHPERAHQPHQRPRSRQLYSALTPRACLHNLRDARGPILAARVLEQGRRRTGRRLRRRRRELPPGTEPQASLCCERLRAQDREQGRVLHHPEARDDHRAGCAAAADDGVTELRTDR